MIKIARRYAVWLPAQAAGELLKVASNARRRATRPNGRYSSEEHDPSAPEEYNEFVAARHWASAIISQGRHEQAARAAEFSATDLPPLRRSASSTLPRSWRAPLIGLYNSLAWRIARKGL